MKKETFKNRKLKEYIKKYILPSDTKENQINYLKGIIEYDLDYIKEHIKHNTLTN